MKRSSVVNTDEQAGTSTALSDQPRFDSPIEIIRRTNNHFEFVFKQKIKVVVHRGSVLKSYLDMVIIHSNVNLYPKDSFFTSRHLAGELRIWKACDEITNFTGPLSEGQVIDFKSQVDTTAFFLHTVMPTIEKYGKRKAEFEKSIENAYLNALLHASDVSNRERERNANDILDTVGVQISAGSVAQSEFDSCKCIFQAIEKYYNARPLTNVDNITIAIRDEEYANDERIPAKDVLVYFDQLLYKYNMRHLKERHERETAFIPPGIRIHSIDDSHFFYTYEDQDLEVNIAEGGNLVRDPFDVILRPARPCLTFYNLDLDQQIKEASEDAVPDECFLLVQSPNGLEPGTVVHTESHMSNCKYCIHGIIPDQAAYKDRSAFYDLVEGCLYRTLVHADKTLNVKRLGISMKSLDEFDLDHEECAIRLLSAIDHFLRDRKNENNNNGSLRCVTIVNSGSFHPVLTHVRNFVRAYKPLKKFKK